LSAKGTKRQRDSSTLVVYPDDIRPTKKFTLKKEDPIEDRMRILINESQVLMELMYIEWRTDPHMKGFKHPLLKDMPFGMAGEIKDSAIYLKYIIYERGKKAICSFCDIRPVVVHKTRIETRKMTPSGSYEYDLTDGIMSCTLKSDLTICVECFTKMENCIRLHNQTTFPPGSFARHNQTVAIHGWMNMILGTNKDHYGVFFPREILRLINHYLFWHIPHQLLL